jgi:hypothetical protein
MRLLAFIAVFVALAVSASAENDNNTVNIDLLDGNLDGDTTTFNL